MLSLSWRMAWNYCCGMIFCEISGLYKWATYNHHELDWSYTCYLKKNHKPETRKTWVTLKASTLTGHVCIKFFCVESFQNDQCYNLSCRMKPHLKQMVCVLSCVYFSDFWRENHKVSEVPPTWALSLPHLGLRAVLPSPMGHFRDVPVN